MANVSIWTVDEGVIIFEDAYVACDPDEQEVVIVDGSNCLLRIFDFEDVVSILATVIGGI